MAEEQKKEIPITEQGALSLPGKRERIFMLLIRMLKFMLRIVGRQLIKHRTKRLTRRIEGR